MDTSTAMKPLLLITTDTKLPADALDRFEERYQVYYAPTPEEERRAYGSDWIGDVRAVFALGSRGVKPDVMDLMPKLEIVVCKGAGYDGFDIPEMNRRGIHASHGGNSNASFVADHAVAMLFATVRHIAEFNAAVHRGEWSTARRLPPSITGKKLGLVGLGSIGSLVARRLSAGFGMQISYHTRQPRPDEPYRHYPDLVQLAAELDFLLLLCPGGPGTYHLVNAAVLEAIGPKGYLVNMARGTVVDTDALVAALRDKKIAGAGLDVVEGEPVVPEALLAFPNVVITPHVGGHAPEAADKTLDLVLENLDAHFAGKPLLTPIPGSLASGRLARF